MATLGVVVWSFDGMGRLGACLESVAWADRVLLLHAGAGDPMVGREFPALSLRRLASWAPADDYATELDTDWVLYLWGDERVDDALAEELRALKNRGLADAGRGYAVSVRSLILNRWVDGGISGPNPVLRVGRGTDSPPGWWTKKFSAQRISRGFIEDRGTAEIAVAVERVQAQSDIWAARLAKIAGAPGALGTILAAARVKLRVLFANGVFAGGLAGIALAALASYAVLLSGAKAWEARYVTNRRSEG